MHTEILFYGLMASPPTKAHQEIINQLEKLARQKTSETHKTIVMVVPSADGVPVNNKFASATAPHRLEMLNLALQDSSKQVVVSDIEIALNQLIGLPSYTVNTLIVLKEGLRGLLNKEPLEDYLLTPQEKNYSEYQREFLIKKRIDCIEAYLKNPTHEFLTEHGFKTDNTPLSLTLAIGMDSYNSLSHWNNAQDFIKNSPTEEKVNSLLDGLIVFERGNALAPTHQAERTPYTVSFYNQLDNIKSTLSIPESCKDYSSTYYRNNESQKKTSEMVPSLVHTYAQAHGLYSAPVTLNVGTASLALKGQDWSRNLKLIYEAIDRAYDNGDHLLCFGELTLTSPDCSDNFQYSDNNTIRELLQYVADYASKKNIIVSIGHPWYFADKTVQADEKIIHRQNTAQYNRLDLPFIAQSILYQSKVIAMTAKTMLERDGYQNRHFQAWHPEEGVHGVIDITLPEMTYHATRVGEESITIPAQSVPFGSPVIEIDMNGKTITLSQIIGNQIPKKPLTNPTHIVLNPYTNVPIALNKQLEKNWEKQSAMRDIPLYVGVETSSGNAGGEYAHFGSTSITSYGYQKIDTLLSTADEVSYHSSEVKFYAPQSSLFNHKNINVSQIIYDVNSEKNQHQEIQNSLEFSPNASLEQAQFELTMYNDARWLFDYLRYSGFKSVVMNFSGDVNSVYNAIKVRSMVELMVRQLGIEKFAQELGYSQEIATDINALMQKILICITFPDGSEQDKKNQQFIQHHLGARCYSYTITDLVNQSTSLFEGIDFDNKTKDQIKNRTQAVFVLQFANLHGGIGIANTNLDNLCDNDFVFGGDLQGGQIATSASKWREDQIQDMKKISQPDNPLGIFIDCHNFIPSEQQAESYVLTDAQRRRIFQLILKDDSPEKGRKNNPIEVFEQCYQTPLFQHETIPLIYEKIKQRYDNWAEAQIGIHAKPLSPNFDHNGVNHEELRTPNVHGYHRQELAQLTLYCLLKANVIDRDCFNEFATRALIDNTLCQTLLNAHWEQLISPNYFDPLRQQTIASQEKIKPIVSNETTEKISLKIATASCNQTAQDWALNVENICKAIDAAVEDGADILSLQELGLSGYDCDDTFKYTNNAQIYWLLDKIAQYAQSKNPNLILSVGHPWKLDPRENPFYEESDEGLKPFNVQTILSNGKIVSMSAKKFLYNYSRGYESRHFSEWSDEKANKYGGRYGTINIKLPNSDMIPFGSPVIEANKGNQRIRLFHAICEESWIGEESEENFAQDNPLAIRNKEQSITCALNPNGSPPSPGKHWISQALAKKGSKHCQVFVHSNAVGTDSSSMVYLGSCQMAQNGEIRSEGPMLSTKPVIYSSQIFQVNSEAELIEDKQPHATISHQFSHTHTPGINNQGASWYYNEQGEKRPEEDILFEMEVRNELLWLFDVMRKRGISGFTQALSGGADSAYNAAKVRLMPQMVIQEQGLNAFLNVWNCAEEEKNRIRSIWQETIGNSLDEPCPNMGSHQVQAVINEIMKTLLTCVSLQTNNNSAETLAAAKALIEGDEKHPGIGGQYLECNIQPLVEEALWSFADIQAPHITCEQKAQVLVLLKQFFGYHPTSIQAVYNEYGGNNEHQENLSKKEKEQSMLKAIKEAFAQKILAVLGPDASIHGQILSPIDPSHGLTLENLQARIREIVILLITDHQKKWGISNPNLNEAIRAYTTFLGDLFSGHLCLNAHKHKFLQLATMTFLSEKGLQGIPPICFEKILNNKPSAELQPQLDGQQAQTDEKAMLCTYQENQIIAEEMFGRRSRTNPERKQNPIEIFEALKERKELGDKTPEELYQMILVSYKAWVTALHKIWAAPFSTTYGDGHYADPKKSMRTPFLNAYHATELGQLLFHCINEIAKREGTSFEAITGYPFEAAKQKILLDSSLTATFENLMWTDIDSNQLGSPRTRQIKTLYDKLKNSSEVREKIGTLFSQENEIKNKIDHSPVSLMKNPVVQNLMLITSTQRNKESNESDKPQFKI